jgi:hypothetical protein
MLSPASESDANILQLLVCLNAQDSSTSLFLVIGEGLRFLNSGIFNECELPAFYPAVVCNRLQQTSMATTQ